MNSKLDQKRDHWYKHLKAWRASTLSQQDYCREHGLKSSQFWYWRKKQEVLSGEIQPNSVTASGRTPSAFIPVELQASTPYTSDLVIELHTGIRITGINAQTLNLIRPLVEVLS